MSKNIQVFCTKSIRFVHPKDESVYHEIKNHAFTSAPEWIKDTAIFNLLVKENSLKVIESSKDLAEVETTGKIAGKELEKENYVSKLGAGVDLKDEEPEEVEEVEAEEEAAVDPKDMSNKELYALCVEKGLEVEEKKNKAYYLEKLESLS